jgi:cytoskeleton-associated protein 5
VWPEYPEEPRGQSIFGALKKSWAPALPQTTATMLFPETGIKKQDDAQAGCDILKRAIEIDESERTKATIEQLDLILKWFAFAFASKETSVGLQTILDFIRSLLSFLKILGGN